MEGTARMWFTPKQRAELPACFVVRDHNGQALG